MWEAVIWQLATDAPYEKIKENNMIDIGNRIITGINRPPRELVEAFRGMPSSNIGDMMNRLYCMHSDIRALSDRPLLGTAVTVKAPEGDNVFLHRAMDIAQPGDVIVVDGQGCTTRALMGEIMLTYAWKKGIEGFVIDGAVRDSDAFQTLDISVYAKAITPQGPYKNGPGEINVPIACGGQVVMPGDIIAGDRDGICVIPSSEAFKLADIVKEKFLNEQKKLTSYRAGKLDEEIHQKTYITVTDKIGTFYDFRAAEIKSKT